MTISRTILKSLIYDEDFARKTLVYFQPKYFTGWEAKLFPIVRDYFVKYNATPGADATRIEVSKVTTFGEVEYEECLAAVNEFETKKEEKPNSEWLLHNSEKFCQDRAIYLAMSEGVLAMDGKHKTLQMGAVPKLIADALGVSFTTNVGHDYLDDAEARYDYIHQDVKRIPFSLKSFNDISKGGMPPKTLNLVLAGIHVGKSQFLVDCAAAQMLAGFNVLYITLEMAPEWLAERIDANLLNIPIEDIENIPKDEFLRRIGKLRERKGIGKLKLKEYPAGTAGAIEFEALLNELKMKENFTPDIILIDYLTICKSSFLKMGQGGVNTYTYFKSIAEELRSLAQRYNLPILSAIQLNRTGFSNSDPDMDDSAESFGLPATADFMVTFVTDEMLEDQQQLMVKQVKNRYRRRNVLRRFAIGFDPIYMRLYDLDANAQKNLPRDDIAKPVFVRRGNTSVNIETGEIKF